MPIETYHDQLEPKDKEAIIWRFMNFEKFQNLIVSNELYFCRADLFNENDEREGLPPQEFLMRWNLDPLDVRDRRQLIVLDNLREGVAVPDIYDPTVNPLFRDVLAHYGVVALSIVVRVHVPEPDCFFLSYLPPQNHAKDGLRITFRGNSTTKRQSK